MAKISKKKRKTGKKKPINGRVSKFIDNFINTDNATQSAIDAGYSKKGANRTASRLLTKVDVQEEIARRRIEITKKAEITAQDVINEHAKIAFANSEDFFKWGEQVVDLGENKFEKRSVILIKPPEEIKRDKKAAISGIKETAQGGLEFKFHDKQKSLDFLGRYFGISNDAEVNKVRRINKGEDPQDKTDVTEGMSPEEVEDKIKELQ